MRVRLKDVSTSGLEAALPLFGTSFAFTFGPTRELDGTLELAGDRLRAEEVSIATQTIRPGRWTLPDLGTLELTQPLLATGIRANAEVPLSDPLGLVGKLTVDGVLAERARLRAFGCEAELRLALRQLELAQAADRTRQLSVDCVEIDEVTAATPFGHLLVGQVVLRGLTAILAADGSLELGCERVQLDSLELKAKELDAHVERVTLTDLHHAAGRTSVEGISVGAVTLEARALPVASLLPPAWTAPRPPGPFVPPRLPDVPFLDDLRGRVNVNAFLDVGLPIIKSHAATHTVRQELVDGTIDFKKLEAGLAGLEDAVLDFEVKPGKLILEKDIPLIPWDNTTLVWWPLDATEHQLAKKQHRVRLRRLLDYTLTDFVLTKLQPKAFAGAPLVTLRRIELSELDVDVSVNGPSQLELPFLTLRLGAQGCPAVRRARVTGAVKLAPGVATPPTTLSLLVDGVSVGLDRLALLGLTAALESLTVAVVDQLDLTFDGVLPSAARAHVTGVDLHGAQVDGLDLPPLRF